MAEIDYEKEYDNRARVPEHPHIFSRWADDAAAYRAQLPASRQSRIAHGKTEREHIDLFLAPSDGDTDQVPLAVFVHGGWWRSFEPILFSHLARGLNAHGINVAMAGYNLCPQVHISDIIEEIRQAVLCLWRLHRCPMLVFGHSAGGHLAAAMTATNWPDYEHGAPADLVPAAYAISGVFDLLPLLHVAVNRDLRLDAERARAASPLLWPVPRGHILDAVVGSLESNEFLRQSRAIADVWGRAGAITRYGEIEGTNHFTVLEPLADPASPMVARLVELSGLC